MPLTENYLGTLNKKKKQSSTQDYLSERYGQVGQEPEENNLYDFMGSALWGAASGLTWGLSDFANTDDEKWENMSGSERSGWILGEGLSLMAPVVGPFALLGKGSRLAVKGANKYVGKAASKLSKEVIENTNKEVVEAVIKSGDGALGKTVLNSRDDLASHLTKEIGKMTDDTATGVRWINQLKGSVDDASSAATSLVAETHSIIKNVFKKAGQEIDDDVVRNLSENMVKQLGKNSDMYVNDISEYVTRGLLNQYPNWMGETAAKYIGMAANDMAIMTMHGGIAGIIKEQSKDEEFSTTSTLGHSAMMALIFPAVRGLVKGGGSDKMSTGIKGFFSRYKKTDYDAMLKAEGGEQNVKNLLRIMIEGEGKAVYGSSKIKDSFWNVGKKHFSGTKAIDAIEDGTMTGLEAVALLKKMKVATSKEFLRKWRPAYRDDLIGSMGRMAVGVAATNTWMFDADNWEGMESSELASHIFMSAIMTKSRGHWGKADQAAYFNKLSPYQNLSARLGLSHEKLNDFLTFHDDTNPLVGLGAAEWGTKTGKRIYKDFEEAKKGEADPGEKSFDPSSKKDRTLLELEPHYNMIGRFRDREGFQPINVRKLNRATLDRLSERIESIELEGFNGKTIKEVGFRGALTEITGEVALAGEKVYKKYLQELSDVLGLKVQLNEDGTMIARFLDTRMQGQSIGVLRDVGDLIRGMSSLNMLSASQTLYVEDALESHNKTRLEAGKKALSLADYTNKADEITNKWMKRLNDEYDGKLYLNKLQENNPFWEHIVNSKYVKATNKYMMIAEGSGNTEALRAATESIDKFFMVPNGKNEFYSIERMKQKIPNYQEYEQGNLKQGGKEWNKVQEMIDTLDLMDNLVNLRKISRGADTIEGAPSKELKPADVNVLKYIFDEHFTAEGLPKFFDQPRAKQMMIDQVLNVKGFDQRAYKATIYLVDNYASRINADGKIEMLSKEAVVNQMRKDKHSEEDILQYEKARDTLDNTLGKENIAPIHDTLVGEATTKEHSVLDHNHHISEVIGMADKLNSSVIRDLEINTKQNLKKLKAAGGGKYLTQLQSIFHGLENIVNSFNPDHASFGKVIDPIAELKELSANVDKVKEMLSAKKSDDPINQELRSQLNEVVLSIDTLRSQINPETGKWSLPADEMVQTKDGRTIADMSEYEIRKHLIDNPQRLLLRMAGNEEYWGYKFEKLVNDMMSAKFGDINGEGAISEGSIKRHNDNFINMYHEAVGKEGRKFKSLSELVDYVSEGGNFAFSEVSHIIKAVQIELNRDVAASKKPLNDVIRMIDDVQDKHQMHTHNKTILELATEFGFAKDGKVSDDFKQAVIRDPDLTFVDVKKYIDDNTPNPQKAASQWKEFKKHAPMLIDAFESEVIGTEVSLEILKGTSNNSLVVDSSKPVKNFATMRYMSDSEILMARMNERITIISKDGKARKVNLSTYDDVLKIQESIVNAFRRDAHADKELNEFLKFGQFGEEQIQKYIRDVSDNSIGSEPLVYVRLSPNDKMLIPMSDVNSRKISQRWNTFVEDFLTDPRIPNSVQEVFEEYTKDLSGTALDARAVIELKVLLPYLDYTGKRSEIIKLFSELSSDGGSSQSKLYKIQANIYKRGFLSDGGTTTPLTPKANEWLINNTTGIVKDTGVKIKSQGDRLAIQLYNDEAAESWIEGKSAAEQHELNNRRTVDRDYQKQIDDETYKIGGMPTKTNQNKKDIASKEKIIGLIRMSQTELADQLSLNSSRLDGIKYASEGLMAYVMAHKGQFNIDFIKSANGAKTIISAIGKNQLLGKGYLVYDPAIASIMEANGTDILLGNSAAKTLWGDSFQRVQNRQSYELVSPQDVSVGNFGINIANARDRNRMYIGLDELSVSFTSKMGGKVTVPSSIFDWQSPGVVNKWIQHSKFREVITELSHVHGHNGKIDTDVIRRLMDIEVENGNPMTDGHTSVLKLILEFGGNSELPHISAAVNRFATNFVIRNVGKNIIDTGSDMITTPDMDGTLRNSLHIKLYDKLNIDEAYERVALQYGGVGVGKSSTHRPMGEGSVGLLGETLIVRDDNGIDWVVRMEGGKRGKEKWSFSSTFYDKLEMIDAEGKGKSIDGTRAKTEDASGNVDAVEVRDIYESGNLKGVKGKAWRKNVEKALNKLSEVIHNEGLSYSQTHELITTGITRVGSTQRIVRAAGGNAVIGNDLNKIIKKGKVQFGMLDTAVPSLGKDQIINRVQRINDKMNGLIEVNVNDLRTIMQRDNDGDHMFTQTRPPKEILNAFLLEQGKVSDFPIFSDEVKNSVKTLDNMNILGLDTRQRRMGVKNNNIGFTQYASQVDQQSRAIGTFIGQRGSITWASRMGLSFNKGVDPLLKEFWKRFNFGSKEYQWLEKFMVTAQNSVDYHDGRIPIFDSTDILLDFVLYGRLSRQLKENLLDVDKDGKLSKFIKDESHIFADQPFLEGGHAGNFKTVDMQRRTLRVIFSTLKDASMVSNDTWDEKGKHTPLPHEFERTYIKLEQLMEPLSTNDFIAREVYRGINREFDPTKRKQLLRDFVDTFFKPEHLRQLGGHEKIHEGLKYPNSEAWNSLNSFISFDVKSAAEGFGVSIPGNMLEQLMTTKFGQSAYGGTSARSRSQVELQKSIGNYINNLEYAIEIAQIQKDIGAKSGEETYIDIERIGKGVDNNVRRAISNGLIIEILENRMVDLKKSLDFEINDSFPSDRKINGIKKQMTLTESSINHMDELKIKSLVIEKSSKDRQIQKGDGKDMDLKWLKAIDKNKEVSVYRLADTKDLSTNTADADKETLQFSGLSYFDLEFMGNKRHFDTIRKQKGYTYIIDMNPKEKLQATDTNVVYGDALSRLTARDRQAVQIALGDSFDAYSVDRTHLVKKLYALSIDSGQKAKTSSVYKNDIYNRGATESGYDFNQFITKWIPVIESGLSKTSSSKDALEILISDLISPDVSRTKFTIGANGKEVPVFQTNNTMLDNVFKHLMHTEVGRTDIMESLIKNWELTKNGGNPDDLRAEIYYEQSFDAYDWDRLLGDPSAEKSMLEYDGLFYSSPVMQDIKRRIGVKPSFIQDKKIGGRLIQVETIKKPKKGNIDIFAKESGGC